MRTLLRAVPRFILPATAAALALLAVESTKTTAQAKSNVDGAWAVTWDVDIKSSEGKLVRVNKRGRADLTLTRRGDSLSGVWSDALVGKGAVIGSIRGDSVTLVTPGPVGADGKRVSMSWQGVLRGERLSGSMWVRAAGLPSPAPRSWEAVRP